MVSTSIVIVGAATHVLAWLLPAYKEGKDAVPPRIMVRGWEAFWFALWSNWPSKDDPFSEWYWNILNRSSAVSNFILAGTLLDVFLNAGHPHPIVRTALFLCAVLNIHWLLGPAADLRVGYYLWVCSFFLIAGGLATTGGVVATWTSMERFLESSLIVISAAAVLAGIYVAWMHLVSRTEPATENPELRQSEDTVAELKRRLVELSDKQLEQGNRIAELKRGEDTKRMESQPVPISPRYEGLAAKLIGHTWLVLTYAVLCVVLLYILQVWANMTILFVTAELPALILTTAVLRNDDGLLFRVPFTWAATALIVWGCYHASRNGAFSIPNELVAFAVTCVVICWFARAIMGTVAEYNTTVDENTKAVSQLLSAWGATLQVTTISLLLIQPILLPVLKATTIGVPLVASLTAIKLTSPWTWFPMGLLLLGLFLHVALLFKTDPYIPNNFEDVLADKGLLIEAVRLPIWLCNVMGGFIKHFLRLLRDSVGVFFERWVGRLILILLGLTLPTILLALAHWAILEAMSYIIVYLSPNGNTLGNAVLTLVVVHALVLLGLCLFVISPPLLKLEITPTASSRIRAVMESFWRVDWRPAANSVGRSFSLYGSLVLAVPLAAILPGRSSLGAFSITYSLIIAIFLLVQGSSRRNPKERTG